jgi:broad specificity phosphatase PhoE
MRFPIRAALALALAMFAPATAPAAPAAAAPDTATTTVVLVRHAEKDTNWAGADQPLSAAGLLRARELARALGEVRFSTIFVTPWARTRQTAEPLARQLGDSLTVIDAIDETVRRVREHRGETVLVVGHSNTVPQIVAGLMGAAAPESLSAGYDDLFVLTLSSGRRPALLRLRYGAVAALSH